MPRQYPETSYTLSIDGNEADTYRNVTKEQAAAVFKARFGIEWLWATDLLAMAKRFDSPIVLERYKLRIECHKSP